MDPPAIARDQLDHLRSLVIRLDHQRIQEGVGKEVVRFHQRNRLKAM